MSRNEFRELTGEYPEDVLGNDWENVVNDEIDDILFSQRAEQDKCNWLEDNVR